MKALINRKTRVICQGFTGKQGTFHSQKAIAYGTKIVGGVTPGKGGTYHLGLPVFDTIEEAVYNLNPDVSIIYVPAISCKDAILESIAGNIKLIICITEGVPIIDMMEIKSSLKNSETRLIGPSSSGIIVPEICKIGVMPDEIYKPGNFGVIARSGALMYEVVNRMTDLGLGQSLCMCVGNGPIVGIDFVEALEIFDKDPMTDYIVMIGEEGGCLEENLSNHIMDNIKKPIFAYVAGSTTICRKRLMHPEFNSLQGLGGVEQKINILKKEGVLVGQTLSQMLESIRIMLDV